MLDVARVIVLIMALVIVGVGLLFGGLGILLSAIGPGADRLIGATLSTAVLSVSLGLGLPLAWHAWQAIRSLPSRPFRPARVWLLGVAFVAAVVAGQAALATRLAAPLAFPPFHVVAMAAPPLAILGLAGRTLAGATRWRDVVLQLSSGAFLATLVAFGVEIAAIMGLAAAVVIAVAVQPGGEALVTALARQLQDPLWLQDPGNWTPLLRSPATIALVLLVFAVAIPLIEETFKTVGVALLAFRRPTLAQAYLWGLAGGAGFALAEGLVNGATDLDTWAPVALARVGATLLHCFTGALMGLAWYRVLVERRWGVGLGLYGASVALHGLWNGLAVGISLGEPSRVSAASVPPAEFAFPALLALIAIGTVVGIGLLTRHVQACSRTPLLPEAAPDAPGPPVGPDPAYPNSK